MAKKSETLRQREKAQKDLLELKKMQRGDINPETLRDDHKKITPRTFAEKRENFLFYHKYKVLAVLMAVIVLAIVIHSYVSTPDYDATLTIYCYEFVGDKDIEDIDKWIESYFPDANGNGKVDVLTTDCSFGPDTTLAETVNQRQLKIQSILLEEDSLLFILDDESLKYLNSITESFTLFKEENIVELGENFYTSISGEQSTLTSDKKRYICLRTVDGTAVEKEAGEHYINAKNALNKIKTAQK